MYCIYTVYRRSCAGVLKCRFVKEFGAGCLFEKPEPLEPPSPLTTGGEGFCLRRLGDILDFRKICFMTQECRCYNTEPSNVGHVTEPQSNSMWQRAIEFCILEHISPDTLCTVAYRKSSQRSPACQNRVCSGIFHNRKLFWF